jgi:diguanylate cyclase (GGDEF)-like protein
LGGDEFAVLLHDADDSAAQRVAERILNFVGDSAISGVPARVSLGIATGGPDSDPDDVLRRADRAMYEAKGRGGMRWARGDQTDLASGALRGGT